MKLNTNNIVMYAAFVAAMIVDMLAGYFHVIDQGTSTTVFVAIVSLLTGIHINTPTGTVSSVSAAPQVIVAKADNAQAVGNGEQSNG